MRATHQLIHEGPAAPLMITDIARLGVVCVARTTCLDERITTSNTGKLVVNPCFCTSFARTKTLLVVKLVVKFRFRSRSTELVFVGVLALRWLPRGGPGGTFRRGAGTSLAPKRGSGGNLFAAVAVAWRVGPVTCQPSCLFSPCYQLQSHARRPRLLLHQNRLLHQVRTMLIRCKSTSHLHCS